MNSMDPLPAESLESGLDYVTTRVDREGTIEVIDIGRDGIHSEPFLVATWDDTTGVEKGSFVIPVYKPEFIAKSYTPEENIRVAYHDDAPVTQTTYLGDWRSVDCYFASDSQRDTFQDNSGEAYIPAKNAVEILRAMF